MEVLEIREDRVDLNDDFLDAGEVQILQHVKTRNSRNPSYDFGHGNQLLEFVSTKINVLDVGSLLIVEEL